MARLFTLTGMAPDSSEDRDRDRSLVCLIEGGGKLAIWSDSAHHENIDKVLAAVERKGWPVVVRCRTRLPSPRQKEQFGHTHWVRPAPVNLEIVQG